MTKFNTLSAFALSLLLIVGCRNIDEYDNDNDPYDPTLADTDTFPDWSEATHSNAVDPDFDILFDEPKVLRVDLTISTSDWSAMWSDLSSNYRYVNSSGSTYTPVWKPCTFTFDGTDWYKVGVRFKGNSSLSQSYMSGISKLSLKLDFDQYESDYPALTNQRFYGFKQLNLNSNFNDESLIREKVGSDLFRAFGIPSANTNFCEVYINSTYYGLYTLVEEVDDTLISTQFNDGSGNLYKPDDDAASFKSGTYDTSEFYLKTNTDSPDYSDVLALYNALHDSSRTSDNDAWQTQLESVFNVDHFLKWLAANTVIQNWDTYGNMAHNYYLYNNPDDGLLTWIPWDNNEAFQSGDGAIDVDEMTRVSTSWPLISYIFDVAEYEEIYKGYLREFVDEVFIVATMQSLYTDYYNLLLESASAEESGRTFFDSSNPASEFASAISTLKTHVQSRNTVVNNYLD